MWHYNMLMRRRRALALTSFSLSSFSLLPVSLGAEPPPPQIPVCNTHLAASMCRGLKSDVKASVGIR